MRAALGEAHDRGWQFVCFKSDAKELIQAIKIEAYNKEIYGIIKDIKQLASVFSSTYVRPPPSRGSKVLEGFSK
ncbi:unnamed protein product [Arabis nemorensis]|uniref:RNase H type-1 domain-containing protein n=1 Tax=Arabis nemorensis TaxID=586526 RepID=A0A565CLX8_9BRAS|nr:unnamed protein product [Arabis nemorensis]